MAIRLRRSRITENAIATGKRSLDPSDQLAARLARDGDPEPIEFQETDTNFAIGWKANYHIEGRAFVYADRESERVTAILWLSHRQNYTIGLNRKLVRRCPTKGKSPACLQNKVPKAFGL